MKSLHLRQLRERFKKPPIPRFLLFCGIVWLAFNKNLDIKFSFNPLDATKAGAKTIAHKEEGVLTSLMHQVTQNFSGLMDLFPKREAATIDPEKVDSLVKSMGHIAVTERRRHGIPSSVLIAAAILLSDGGKAPWAISANNLFYLPCTEDWQGAKYDSGTTCLRSYENPWTSFRDFSFYLTTGKNFSLRSLSANDYKSWARAIEDLKFHEVPNLGKRMTDLIERYNLQVLDQD